MSARLSIELFGPVQARVDGAPLPRMRSRRALWLLALLVLRNGRPAARGWLATTLWPDVDMAKALSSLRPLISELKKALGPEASRLRSEDRNSLVFDVHDISVDALAFDEAIKLGDLSRAAEIYRGPLMEGCDEEWAYQERRVREENFLSALQQLGDVESDQGDYAKAMARYQRAISVDAWRDSPRRGLMKSYEASGDTNAALQAYREYANLLSREFGTAPEAETTAIYERLRNEVRKSRRGRDRETHPNSAEVANNLPSLIGARIGRDDEQIDITAMVRKQRLVTLTGVGGTGKTHLAISISRDMLRGFPDGVWFFGLESIDDPGAVPAELATALGLREDSKKTVIAALVESLRGSRRLLVFDNCEHLVKAVSSLAEELLRGCPELRILATSREPLGVSGEVVWPISGLTYPDANHLPSNRATRLRVAMSYESVRLFVERAQSLMPDFKLDIENVMSVVDICTQVEGNPLAIELASARVRSMTPQKLSQRLTDHHLETLKSREQGTSSRKHSVRGTLDWSYELLTREEQVLLQRLAIFAGSWTLEAAESVAGGKGIESNAVADLLGSLVEKSLVVFDPDTDRYRLLETVRQYAAEKLSLSGDKNLLLANLRRWSEAFVTEHEMAPAGPDQSHWAKLVGLEFPNLRIALESCSEDPLAGLAICRRLGRLFTYLGLHREGLAMLLAALGRKGAKVPTLDRAHALFAAASFAADVRNWDLARTLLQESQEIFGSVNNLEGVAWTLSAFASLEVMSGNQDLARGYFEQTLDIARTRGDKAQLADALYNYSAMLVSIGEPEAFRDAALESMELHKELGGTLVIAWQLRVLALYEWWTGKWDEASRIFDEGINLLDGSDDFLNQGYMFEFASRFAREMGDLERAERLVEESEQAFKKIDFDSGIWMAQWTLCSVRLDQDRVDEAQEIAERLITAQSWTSDRRLVARATEEIGAVALARGDLTNALSIFREGLALCIEDKFLRSIPLYLERLAVRAHLLGEFLSAANFLGAADVARAKIRLAVPPYRIKFLQPVIDSLATELGYDGLEAAKSEGRNLDLRSVAGPSVRSEAGLAEVL